MTYCSPFHSVWNNKVKAKLREEVALADKENEFTSGDIDSEPYVSFCTI